MKKFLLIFLLICLLFTTACWDMIELEDRILPYSLAIDISEDSVKPFLFCFSYPNINAFGKSPTQDKLVYIINTNANSIFDATHELSSTDHYPIFLKHLNVLIMSEGVYTDEKNVRQIFDGVIRDFRINKMIYLLITKSSSHELLTTKLQSKRQETIEGLLVNLLRNEQESNKFTPIRIMEFIHDIDNRRVVVVPLATPNDDIEIAGGGLFKDYKFIGYIDDEENKDINILNNVAYSAELDMEYNGANLSFQLAKINSKKKLVKKDELKFEYTIKVDGQIQEYIIDEDKKIDSVEILEDLEDKLNKLIESELTTTIEKLQKVYNADVLGLLEYLYKFHPKIYKEVEDKWDSIFPFIEIDVNVDVEIRRRGLSI